MQQAKAVQKKDAGKKVVIKKAPASKAVENRDEFESVTDKPATAGRGGRGRGEGRGGRGRGGDRDGQTERRGGERGGRGGERCGRGRGEGRGGRGRGERRERTEGGDVVEGSRGRGERRERGEKRFEGKSREDAHPMDRQDGTGRGRRGDRKGGNTRGGWEGKPAAEGEENKDGEATGAAPEEEKRAPRREREPRPAVVEEEEEEVGYTLDDYMNDKQAKSKGLMAEEKKIREHEKIQDKVAGRDATKTGVNTIDTQITSRDVHAIRPAANANLLGFQAPADDGFEERPRGGRGAGRGGRGGRDDREPRGGRKGGRGGKLVIDDDAFPAL